MKGSAMLPSKPDKRTFTQMITHKEIHMKTTIAFLRLLVLVLLLLPLAATAQNVWTSERGGSVVALEYMRPAFTNNTTPALTAQTFTLTGRFQLHSGDIVKFELPYATAHQDDMTFSYPSPYGLVTYKYAGISSNAVGNLYAGIELRSEESKSSFDLGLRLPMTSDKETAPFMGIMTDVDRYEAFVPHLLAMNALYNYTSKSDEKLAFRFRFGPTLWVNTKSNSGSDDTEVLLAYSLQGGIQTETFDCIASYAGRMIVTESGELSKRMFHQLGVLASANIGIIHPGLYYRVPLDDKLKNVITGVLGVSLGVEL